jgi:cell division protein FtsQ
MAKKRKGIFRFIAISAFALTTLGLLSFAVVFGVQTLSGSGYFKVKSVQVKGVIKADGSKVEKMVKSLVGKSIFDIENDNVECVEDTWVERMEIRKVFPDRLEVVVFEKKPVFQLTNTKGCFTATSSGLLIKDDCRNAPVHMNNGVDDENFKEFIRIYEDTAQLSEAEIELKPFYFTVKENGVTLMGNYDREGFAKLYKVYSDTVKKRYKAIDYVDMRIPDKIYVKGVM